MPINSLCLIPELSCGRMCLQCYEKKKIYSVPLPIEEYMSLISKSMESLPSLTEVLIDYNGVEPLTSINSLVGVIPKDLPIYITTTPAGMMKLRMIERNIWYRLSLHNSDDTALAAEIIYQDNLKAQIESKEGKVLSRGYLIDCFSVMITDVQTLSLPLLKGAPLYILFDKFSELWKSLDIDLFDKFLEACNGLSNLTMDHCLQTRSLNHECPADSQINIYRDGSIRRCPYQPMEPPDADYSTGCALIRS